MEIKTLVVGPLQTNCYIVSKINHALIIDPGDEPERIINYIEGHNLIVDNILITHHHFDHVGALNALIKKYNVDVIDYNSNGNYKFEIIKNPGHTSDSITFYFKEEKVMFIGDFIFMDGIGRTDLPTGNKEEMINSLKMMKKYDQETTIYPGHGPSSILGIELNKWIK